MKARSICRLLTGSVVLPLVLAIGGCAAFNEDITLRPVSRVEASSIGQGQRVAVTVVDERPSRLLGIRGHLRSAEIRAVQDVPQVVGDAIRRGLQNQGFEPVPHTDAEPVTLEVQIKTFNYDATGGGGFFTGGIYTNAVFKVVAHNGDSDFDQVYRSEITDEAFITPTEAEDSAQINQTLSDVLDRVLSDQQLLNFLAERATDGSVSLISQPQAALD